MKLTEREKIILKAAREEMKAYTNIRNNLCPFRIIGAYDVDPKPNAPELCQICHKWMRTLCTFEARQSHPCDYLPAREVVRRFWRKIEISKVNPTRHHSKR